MSTKQVLRIGFVSCLSCPLFILIQSVFCSLSWAAPTLQELVHTHNLEKMGPGGFWLKPTYRSETLVIPAFPYDGTSTRAAAGQIEFLQGRGHTSGWNSRKFDETWTYLLGDPLLIHVISAQGEHTLIKVGDPSKHPDAVPTFTLKSQGQILATELPQDSPTGYFFGIAQTSPAFELQDLSFEETTKLYPLFPQHEALIKRLDPND